MAIQVRKALSKAWVHCILDLEEEGKMPGKRLGAEQIIPKLR